VKPRAGGLLLGAALGLASIARAQDPPPADLTRALASHAYLSKLELQAVEGPAPYLFLFQRVAGSPPTRIPNIVNQLAPALDATLEVFEQRIAKPNELAPRPGHERFVVVVLASRSDLENYQRVVHAPWHMNVWALHDRALNACVVYEDAFAPERASSERARAARHVLLHACQQAWFAGQGGAPLESWLFEGMADALASTGADPSVVRPDPGAMRMLVQDAQDEHRSFANLRTLDELLTLGEASRLASFYRERTPKELEPLDTRDSWWGFYRQASSLFAYFWSDQEARHRPALVAFVGDALRGQVPGALRQRGPGRARARLAGLARARVQARGPGREAGFRAHPARLDTRRRHSTRTASARPRPRRRERR